MNRKMAGLIGAVLLGMTLLSACLSLSNGIPLETVRGSGNVVTEARDVSGFSTVILQGFGDVNIDVTGSESLSITADENFMSYLVTEVRGDTLYIHTEPEVAFTNITALDFDITAADLEAVELQGAGDIDVRNLDTDTWRVRLPGAGQITAAGRAAEQSIELLGAGSYEAENLESEVATVTSSGAGSAVVWATDELDVTINGIGTVQYIGNPVVTQEINGLGTVQQR